MWGSIATQIAHGPHSVERPFTRRATRTERHADVVRLNHHHLFRTIYQPLLCSGVARRKELQAERLAILITHLLIKFDKKPEIRL
jgi:hypothetical protein